MIQSFKDVWDEWSLEANIIATEKGWWEDPRDDGTCIALMHSELSEGLEGLRNMANSDKIPGFLAIEEELADCIIRIMDFSEQRAFDVGKAVEAKMEYNRERSHKHGGKKF